MLNHQINVSLLITFHNEGVLAHSTLNSIERCRRYAEEKGIKSEYIWVLDSCSAQTKKVISNHPAMSCQNVKIVEVEHQDLGLSRNAGIAVAEGEAIGIFDGDDYYSTNWIERAWHYLQLFGPQCIFHPEIVINFGNQSIYCWQIDQEERYFDKMALLANNMWTSWNFAARSVYQTCPYSKTSAYKTGFGYEDWHWNCETIASGFIHKIIPGTIGFYRKKKSSLVMSQINVSALIPPSRLFNKDIWLSEENNGR